jgi:predicted N-acetyltransferase YhbS
VKARVRSYDPERDYEAVGRLLVRTYDPQAVHCNWLQPRWEYMHYHPQILERELDLATCGIWTDGEEIVGVAHFEHRKGVNYLEVDPRYVALKAEMLDYAAAHLGSEFKDGTAVYVYLDDRDTDLHAIATRLGYVPKPDLPELTSTLEIPNPFPEIRVSEGFRFRSLEDEFDVRKVHRVMHRGFNHEGEPPEDELDARRRKLSAPNFRRDLTIVAVAPDGDYAAFCGMWMDHDNRVCYIEPVATDPDYRRMGLGTAVVLEGVRRCGAEGATIAYVGSDQAFYKSMGFEVTCSQTPWKKRLSPRSVGT